VPIDPTEPATPTGTDRRAFLTRSAAGGALVATAAATGLAGLGIGTAGAQEASAPPTVEEEYAAKAAALELAAAVAYEAALSGSSVSGELADTLRRFQTNHQTVASTLAEEVHPDAPAPVADPGVTAQFSPAEGADEGAVLSQLAAMEDALSATHLGAIPDFKNTSFAKVLAQALAIEAQQAVYLGRAAGTAIEELTPATATTDGALEAGQAPAGPSTPGDDESDADEDTSEADAGNATDAGNETDTGDDDTDADADSAN
jgi:hypothetical protein